MGDQDGGAQGEPDPPKQVNLVPDYVNDNKYLVNLQISNTKLVLRGNMSFSCTSNSYLYVNLLPRGYRAQTVGTVLLGILV